MRNLSEFKMKLVHSRFEIIESTKFPEVPEWANGDRILTHQMVLFVMMGDGGLFHNGQYEALERDALYMFMPGDRVQICAQGEKPIQLYGVSFDRYALTNKTTNRMEYAREDFFPLQGRVKTVGNHTLRIIALLISLQGAKTGEPRHFQGQQLLLELLDGLLECTPTKSGDAAVRLQETIEYMLDHYQENIQMSEIAALGQFHPSYYSQIFKQIMKKTPIAFITDLRINKAKELLLTTKKPVSDIAASVGFNDEFYFSRRFKRKSGYSPSVFARKREMTTISLSSPYSDHLYTLGHIPRAAQIYRSIPMKTQELHLPEHASDPWNAGREIFMKVKPDLIVCKDNVLAKAQEHINDIAPIVSIPWSSQDIYQHMQTIAGLVHRQESAKHWLEEYERRAETWRKKLRGSVGSPTVALCVCRGRELRMYGARNIGHVFYRSLNLAAPDRISRQMKRYPAGTGFTWTSISPDEIQYYEADFLFIAVENASDKQRVFHWMRSNPFWSSHPAVRKQRVTFINWEKWMMYSPSGIQSQLDEAAYLLMLQR